ncbi:MAG: OmpA family protein, partial [bacterium]
FFLLLFTFSTSKDIRDQFSMKAVEEQFGKPTEAITEIFSKHGIQQIAKLEVFPNRIRLTFLDAILFDPGKAGLKPASIPHLKKLADVLVELPNLLQVEGHTDDRPMGPHSQYVSNWELSAARAFAVLIFLTEAGVPPHRLSALGYGEYRPIQKNDTPEGRAANRRIEINIMRQES